MKIAIITDNPAFCRSGMYLDELATALMEDGIEARVFLIRRGSSTFLESRIPYRRVAQTVGIMPQVKGYDIIQVEFSFPSAPVVALLRRMLGRPLLIHTHGFDVFVVPEINYGLRRNLAARVAIDFGWRRASLILAVCLKAMDEIRQAGVPAEVPVSVLYNGIDSQMFRRQSVADSKLLSIRESAELIFLNVGGLVPVKNQENLISAYAEFVSTHHQGSASKLLICGEGPLRSTLVMKARQVAVERNVVFMGHQPRARMPEIYAISDCFVLPSYSEGHPWSLLEAMSCELPVVASAVGGIPETIPDSRFLIPPPKPSGDSVPSIVSRLSYLAENPQERKHEGRRNREAVLQRFTVGEHHDRLLRLYESTLEIASCRR